MCNIVKNTNDERECGSIYIHISSADTGTRYWIIYRFLTLNVGTSQQINRILKMPTWIKSTLYPCSTKSNV